MTQIENINKIKNFMETNKYDIDCIIYYYNSYINNDYLIIRYNNQFNIRCILNYMFDGNLTDLLNHVEYYYKPDRFFNINNYKEINTLDDEQALKFIVNHVENLDDLFKYINDEIKILESKK